MGPSILSVKPDEMLMEVTCNDLTFHTGGWGHLIVNYTTIIANKSGLLKTEGLTRRQIIELREDV